MTSIPDIRWLAGFIDGEGSFTLSHDRTWNSIRPAFALGNTNVADIAAVKARVSEIVGREVRYHAVKTQPKRATWRPCYYLHVQKQSELKTLCEALLPHVIGKRPQVELMLRYLATTPMATNTRGSWKTGTGYTDDHRTMIAEMKALNRKYAQGEWDSQREAERLAPAEPVEETVRTTE